MNPLPRTTSAIADQLRALQAARSDRFGIESSRYLDALPFAEARHWLANGYTADQWEAHPGRIRTAEDAMKAALDYLPLAWAKANEGSMTSADRSCAHFRGLAWLLNAPEHLLAKLAEPPRFCGKPQLTAVAEWLGQDVAKLDSGTWRTHAHDPQPMTREALVAAVKAAEQPKPQQPEVQP